MVLRYIPFWGIGFSGQKPQKHKAERLLLMVQILHYLKDPKLWELWYNPYYGY